MSVVETETACHDRVLALRQILASDQTQMRQQINTMSQQIGVDSQDYESLAYMMDDIDDLELIAILQTLLNKNELKLEKYEILLQDNPQRYVIYPIHFTDIWAYYKAHQASFWTAEEITLFDDLVDWNKQLSDDERYFIKVF